MSSSFESFDLLLAIPPQEKAARALAGVVVSVLPVPRGGAGAAAVMRLLATCVKYTVDRLVKPTDRARQLQASCTELARCLTELEQAAAVQRPLLIASESTSHPLWRRLLKLAEVKTASPAALLFMGCACMFAIHTNQPLPSTTSSHLRDLLRLELSTEDVECILLGYTPDTFLTETSISRLTRLWRDAVRTFSGTEPPTPDFSDRVRGQLLGTALNPTAAHSAGALDHRQVTGRQLTEVCQMFRHENALDKFLGVLGVMGMRTGLDVELLTTTPLAPPSGWTSHCLELDPRTGTLKVDLRSLVHDAAQPLSGCLPSRHELHIHLPDNVSKSLCTRIQQYPSATCLMNLYPDDPIPDPSLVLLPNSGDGIAVTWSRIRQSLGPWLVRSGMNTLTASLLSLDLSLIGRSKLYYAMVPTPEWRAAEADLYQRLGLESGAGNVEHATLVNDVGFGSQVVPSVDTIRKHDRLLLEMVLGAKPGPNSSEDSLIQHHNAFTSLTAWRVTLLLAMRSATSIDLSAELGPEDRWIAIHDKSTSNAKGYQPVPCCGFVARSIDLYCSHCEALAKRLTGLPPMRASAMARYAGLIGRRQNAKLFWMIDKKHRVVPVSSAQLTESLDESYQLPADVGRKVLENHLRARGLPSALIDQALRHNHAGLIHLSSFNHRDLQTSMRRLTIAIESIAVDLFSEPVSGLSKGKQ